MTETPSPPSKVLPKAATCTRCRRHEFARPDEVAGRDAIGAGRYQPAAARQDRRYLRWGLACRRAGSKQRPRSRFAGAAALWRAKPSIARRRQRAVAQQGHHRRQSAAADPLLLLL